MRSGKKFGLILLCFSKSSVKIQGEKRGSLQRKFRLCNSKAQFKVYHMKVTEKWEGLDGTRNQGIIILS